MNQVDKYQIFIHIDLRIKKSDLSVSALSKDFSVEEYEFFKIEENIWEDIPEAVVLHLAAYFEIDYEKIIALGSED